MTASEEEGPAPSRSLLDVLLDRIGEFIGDGASMAAFRYAAFEEGRRIGSAYRPADLEGLLTRIDAVLDQRSRLVAADPHGVTVEVEGVMATSERPVVQGIALGFLEGAMRGCRGRRHTATATVHNGAAEVVLEVADDG